MWLSPEIKSFGPSLILCPKGGGIYLGFRILKLGFYLEEIIMLKRKKYQRRRILQAPRIYPGSRRTAPGRRKIFFQKTIYWFLISILFFFIIWLVFFSPFFRIQEPTIIGSEITDSEKIKNEIDQIIKKNVFFILPGDNIIFVKPDKIEKVLIQKNPCFQNIKIEKRFPNILKIEISEKEGIIIWCRQENCFFVDKTGVAYADVSSIELFIDENKNQEKMFVVQEEKKEKIEIGQKVASQNFIKFVLEISKELENFSRLKIIALRTPESVSSEIWITTSEGWQVIFDTSRSARNQVANLTKFLNEKISEQERKNLEYIDLRVLGKIYYK